MLRACICVCAKDVCVCVSYGYGLYVNNSMDYMLIIIYTCVHM